MLCCSRAEAAPGLRDLTSALVCWTVFADSAMWLVTDGGKLGGHNFTRWIIRALLMLSD